MNSLQEHSAQSGYIYDRLYRNLFNREFFLQAYQNIYASQGNMTAGTDGQTIDAMSLERIDRLIATLKDESYQSYSGTPQGGIISPILANIYLDQFDKYMAGVKKRFDRGSSEPSMWNTTD